MQRLKQERRPQIYVHDYGKGDARHNRKMGHVTFIDYDLETVESIVRNYWQ
jgi:phosphoribosylaminoimidazole carboxylase (NCAIR synthetase)